MSIAQTIFSQTENLVKHRARAVYIPTEEGGLRLARVQEFNRPMFKEGTYEMVEESQSHLPCDDNSVRGEKQGKAEDIRRAVQRAKVNAFDLILANRDLNCFATMTVAPEAVPDRTSYEQVYGRLKVWLSNKVQRHALKYILVPERHKTGGIHCHMVCNQEAMKLEPARGYHTGQLLTNNGRLIFNITDWQHGFSTAEIIEQSNGDRDAVAKYIFKYMGKQSGETIGGRYFLHGGKMAKPVYVYGECAEELIGAETCRHEKIVTPVDGVVYKEYTFI